MPFIIQTSLNVFSPREIKILKRYGKGFQRLTNGERQPATAAQRRFIQVCRGEVQPETPHEKAWRKYLDRLEWERDPKNREAMGSHRRAEEGFGGSRQDSREMRRADRADFWKRQRE
jgi:uncharacterized protein YifE (UPF0438 family)